MKQTNCTECKECKECKVEIEEYIVYMQATNYWDFRKVEHCMQNVHGNYSGIFKTIEEAREHACFMNKCEIQDMPLPSETAKKRFFNKLFGGKGMKHLQNYVIDALENALERDWIKYVQESAYDPEAGLEKKMDHREMAEEIIIDCYNGE